MPTTDAGALLEKAQAYRDALEDGNQAAVDRMSRSWALAAQRLELEVQQLTDKMEAARRAGVDPSPAWLYQQRRLSALTDSIREEVRRWSPHASEEAREAAYRAARDAQRQARDLAREAARVSLPGLEASFTDLAPENMASILGHLAEGGPLSDLMAGLAGEAVDAAEAALLQGVVLGKGTDWIATQLRRAIDIPRWRAETIARTEALRAFRETSRETYRRSNVVGSWTWTAALDRRTCPACLALHGQEFTLDEHLDGHPRCRCAMVPKTLSWADISPELADLPDTRPTIQTGEEWLAQQSPLTQRSILGPRKYGLWSDGKITLQDMVARTSSPEWGTMRRERSILEMTQGRNANYRDAVPDTPTVRDIPEPEPAPTWLDGLPAKPPTTDRMRSMGIDLESPANDLRAANPNYNQGRQYQVNCTNCVSAYELRRRGFNVQAAPLETLTGGRALSEWGKWWGLKPSDLLAGKMTVLQMKRKLLKEWPEGARGAVTVVWKGRRSGSHIFTVEKRDGELVFLDPQTGKELGDGSSYWDRAQNHVYVFRLDDLTPTPDARNFLHQP